MTRPRLSTDQHATPQAADLGLSPHANAQQASVPPRARTIRGAAPTDSLTTLPRPSAGAPSVETPTQGALQPPSRQVQAAEIDARFGDSAFKQQTSMLINRTIGFLDVYKAVMDVSENIFDCPEVAAAVCAAQRGIARATKAQGPVSPVRDERRALQQLIDDREHSYREFWRLVDAIPQTPQNVLLSQVATPNRETKAVKWSLSNAAEEAGVAREEMQVPTVGTPFNYYMALVLSDHPEASVRGKARRFLEAHDAACEAVESSRLRQNVTFESWWHVESLGARSRPPASDYTALGKYLVVDDVAGSLSKLGLPEIDRTSAPRLMTKHLLFRAKMNHLTLEPNEGSAIENVVSMLSLDSFDFQAPRFNANSGLVDPETHALPASLAARAGALLEEHGNALAANHALLPRLRRIVEEASRLDRESKADGPIAEQIVFLMLNDRHIGELCRELRRCASEVPSAAAEAREQRARQAADDLLRELEGEASKKASNKASKKKKSKAKKQTLSQPEGAAAATKPENAPTQGSESPPKTKEEVPDDVPEPTPMPAPMDPVIVQPNRPINMIRLGPDLALPSRLPKEALKKLLERSIDPATFFDPQEPLWRSAARSMAYHLRKHAANSTAEAYIAEGQALYKEAYFGELGRRADDQSKWLRLVRTQNRYAAYSMDARLISLCNSDLCGQKHFPQQHGATQAWP